MAELACNYRLRAGERAVSRSAYQEAIAHFSAGLKMAERLSDPAERMCRELDFLLKLGPALGLTRGMQSQDAEEAYRRAAEISENSQTARRSSEQNGACGSMPISDARRRGHASAPANW